VLLVAGHAGPAPGDARPAPDAVEAGGGHLSGLSAFRREQFRRGQRGGSGVLGVQARRQGRHHRHVRRPPGPRHGDQRERRPGRHRLLAHVPHVVHRLDHQAVESEGNNERARGGLRVESVFEGLEADLLVRGQRGLRARREVVAGAPGALRGGRRQRQVGPLESEPGHGSPSRQYHGRGEPGAQQGVLDPVGSSRHRRRQPGQDLGVRRGGDLRPSSTRRVEQVPLHHARAEEQPGRRGTREIEFFRFQYSPLQYEFH
jgi:hypothetical protein